MTSKAAFEYRKAKAVALREYNSFIEAHKNEGPSLTRDSGRADADHLYQEKVARAWAKYQEVRDG